MDSYVQLAKQSIESWVRNGEKITLPKDLPKETLEEEAGTFVSIHKGDELRGCIGTFLPTQDSIAKEIVENAISACSHDPRFSPIRTEELANLEIKVDILSEPEPINSPGAIDPKVHGVIVKSKDGRCGLLLPDLPGIESSLEQIAIAKEKAGISPKEKAYLFRFTVDRHE